MKALILGFALCSVAFGQGQIDAAKHIFVDQAMTSSAAVTSTAYRVRQMESLLVEVIAPNLAASESVTLTPHYDASSELGSSAAGYPLPHLGVTPIIITGAQEPITEDISGWLKGAHELYLVAETSSAASITLNVTANGQQR